MSNLIKWVLVLVGAIVGGFVGIFLLGKVAILIAFAIGALAGLVLVSIVVFGLAKTKEHATAATVAVKAAAEKAANKYDPTRDQRAALQALTATNEKVRLTHGVSPAVLTAVESLIDKLAPLIEKLYLKYPSDQTTWNIGGIATNHLPTLVERYLSIAAENRAQAGDDVVSALTALLGEVTNLTTLIDNHNIDDARGKAEVIRARFNT